MYFKEFLKFLKRLYLFLERGREKERKRNIGVSQAPTGALAHNPAMCPDWELNLQPFGSLVALSPLRQTVQGQRLPFNGLIWKIV